MIFYCTVDALGAPLQPVNWPARALSVGQAQADAERLECPSHFVANGNGPRVGPSGSHREWTSGDGLLVDAEGLATTAADEPLRCPQCLAPAAAAAEAPEWVPPEVEVPAPPMRAVYVNSVTLISRPTPLPTDGSWLTLGSFPTTPAGLIDDVSMAFPALVHGCVSVGGPTVFRVTATDAFTEVETVLYEVEVPEGRHLHRTDPGPLGVPPGANVFAAEARLVVEQGTTSGASNGLSLSLNKVVPL